MDEDFLKLTSKNNLVGYYFILFVHKIDKILIEIAIVKHACVVCGIFIHVFIIIILIFFPVR